MPHTSLWYETGFTVGGRGEGRDRVQVGGGAWFRSHVLCFTVKYFGDDTISPFIALTLIYLQTCTHRSDFYNERSVLSHTRESYTNAWAHLNEPLPPPAQPLPNRFLLNFLLPPWVSLECGLLRHVLDKYIIKKHPQSAKKSHPFIKK